MAISTLLNTTLTCQATVPLRRQRLTAEHGLYVNDSWTVVVRVGGLPSGVTADKGWFTIKSLPTDADGSAVVQKIITTTAVTGTGQVTDSGSSTSVAVLQFDFTPVDTALLTALQTYFVDCQWRDQQGFVHSALADSWLTAGQGVTAATS